MKKVFLILFALFAMSLTTQTIAMDADTTLVLPSESVITQSDPIDTLFGADQDTISIGDADADSDESADDEKEGLGWKIAGTAALIIATLFGKKYGWLPMAVQGIKGIFTGKRRKNKKKNSTPDPEDEIANS